MIVHSSGAPRAPNSPWVSFSLRGIRNKSIFALTSLFLLWAIISAAFYSISNLTYVLATQQDRMQLQVTDKFVMSIYGNIGHPSELYLTLRDPKGRMQHIQLDDFFRREVDIHEKSSPLRREAMNLCWNQVYLPGDILLVEGRRSAAGFAIDHIAEVCWDNKRLCQGKNRLY